MQNDPVPALGSTPMTRSSLCNERVGLSFRSAAALAIGLSGICLVAELVAAQLPVHEVLPAAGVRLVIFTIALCGILSACRHYISVHADWASQAPVADSSTIEAMAAPGPVSSGGNVLGAINYFSRISAVLKEETERVIEDTERNAVSLMGELRCVETGMEDLLSFFSAADTNERVVQIVGTTETQLARSQSLIEQFSRERTADAHNVQTAMDDIGTVVGDLGQMIQMVRDLSKQTRMLAFNASIEAARAGVAGRGFAVVASEVKDLSMLSDRAAVQIGKGIEKLQQVVQASLNTIVGQRIARESSGFNDISEAVSDLTDNLQQLFSHQRDTLKKVQYENERLADPIMQMIGSIQFQDVLKRRLQTIVYCFDKINDSIASSEKDMSVMTGCSEADIDSVLQTHLGHMVQFTMKEMQDSRQADVATNDAHRTESIMEMF